MPPWQHQWCDHGNRSQCVCVPTRPAAECFGSVKLLLFKNMALFYLHAWQLRQSEQIKLFRQEVNDLKRQWNSLIFMKIYNVFFFCFCFLLLQELYLTVKQHMRQSLDRYIKKLDCFFLILAKLHGLTHNVAILRWTGQAEVLDALLDTSGGTVQHRHIADSFSG